MKNQIKIISFDERKLINILRAKYRALALLQRTCKDRHLYKQLQAQKCAYNDCELLLTSISYYSKQCDLFLTKRGDIDDLDDLSSKLFSQ